MKKSQKKNLNKDDFEYVILNIKFNLINHFFKYKF